MRIWVSDGDRRLQEGNGYGQISQAVSRGLIELGHEVQFQEFPGMEVALFICPPGKIKFGRQVRTAAITMHELDHLPDSKREWAEVLNRLDLVLTPTEWNREVWRRAGVTTPVKVVPLGVDPELYYPATGRRCTFLSVHENLGGETSREDWRHTLRAYLEAFAGVEDVRLVVKTWKWKPGEFERAHEQTLAELGLAPNGARDGAGARLNGVGEGAETGGGGATTSGAEAAGAARTTAGAAGAAPEIEVIDRVLAAEEMRALYQGAWLFLKNANREGWSMPCTEALACGTPIAATRIEPLLSHLPEQTTWFEPGDVEELQRILRREHARFRSRLRLAQRHDATAMTRLVELALRELVG
jgi:glycosyltransferase involved in cell wall biosynthesis